MAKQSLAVTDDVSIVEAMGLPVFITQGQYTNLKVGWRSSPRRLAVTAQARRR